jgi:hypothetical protein
MRLLHLALACLSHQILSHARVDTVKAGSSKRNQRRLHALSSFLFYNGLTTRRPFHENTGFDERWSGNTGRRNRNYGQKDVAYGHTGANKPRGRGRDYNVDRSRHQDQPLDEDRYHGEDRYHQPWSAGPYGFDEERYMGGRWVYVPDHYDVPGADYFEPPVPPMEHYFDELYEPFPHPEPHWVEEY